MTISMISAFWLVSFLLVITPGADWAFAITAGMRERAVVPAVSGMLLGHLTATFIVAAGVGAFMTNHPAALTALTFFGAAYLLWLGIGMISNPPVARAGEAEAEIRPLRWTAKGFGVSGLNPKVFLLFLALLPQFADPQAAWSLPAQLVALGLVHVASTAVVYLMVGFGSQAVLRTRPTAAQWVGRLLGCAMVLIAALLLGEEVSQLLA